MTSQDLLAGAFETLPDLIRAHAAERPDKRALVDDDGTISYAELDVAVDRVAAALQRYGVRQGESVAIVAAASIAYATMFLGALRAGCVATPLAPSATAGALGAMIADCGAPVVFVDRAAMAAVAGHDVAATIVMLDGDGLEGWLAPAGSAPAPVVIAPVDAFNIIYSSGTTGTPKGIVQSHAMRSAHIGRNPAARCDQAVMLIATPLYSNTTLVTFLPTLGWGGTVVLMAKFDATAYLMLAERHRATHTMLVPVQYQRIMAVPGFDAFDLSAFRLKSCTSAPFAAALKADIVARWPGLLIEYYGMTEGGGSTVLVANDHPDKLGTVGVPIEAHDIRLIDEDGREVAQGETGEVVGRSPSMMTGYHRRDDANGSMARGAASSGMATSGGSTPTAS